MIFKDKTVIITGGSEGVGAATARLFAAAGANLMLMARSRKNLEAIAEELRDKTRVEIFPMDVLHADACVDLFKKAAFEFGTVDILVNNAGFHARGPVRIHPGRHEVTVAGTAVELTRTEFGILNLLASRPGVAARGWLPK